MGVEHMSVSETNLKKLDREQSQAICTCTGAFKTSPISALQVEVGKMPLRVRRDQIMLAYWVNFEGHSQLTLTARFQANANREPLVCDQHGLHMQTQRPS